MQISERNLKQIMACNLFDGCSHDEVLKMVSMDGIRIKSWKAGECILRADSENHFVGIIIKGSAAVERKSEDGLMHMSRLKCGDLFGAVSIFSDEKSYVVDIRCLCDCRILCVNEEQIIEWFQANAILLRNYLRYLNNRIRFLNRRLDALSKNTVASKLMCHFISESKNGIYEVKSYTELSEMLCLSRATMYRALDQLCDEGKILREGKRILILE